MTGALNNKYQFFFDGWFTSVEKLLSAHRYSYSVLTKRKIISKVFTIFWGMRTLYITSWKVHNAVKALVTAISVTWCNYFYNCSKNLQNATVRRLFERLQKLALSKTFLNPFNYICRTQIRETRLSLLYSTKMQ